MGPREVASPRFIAALLALAVLCGGLGAGYTLVLQGVERAAFGFSTGTFAEAITQVAPWHRFAAVFAGGCVVAVLWYGMRSRGPRIPSVADIAAGARVSPLWMLADTVLQVVNVALGASIGREGAPRQAGALAGAIGGDWLRLSPPAVRVLVACGAGAGLAALYNVPFGGALFAVEVVLGWRVLKQARRAALGIVVAALLCAWIATVAARVVVPDRPTYAVALERVDAGLLVFALVAGPLLAIAGHAFGALVSRAQRHAPRGRALLWRMPLSYLLLGLAAIPFPLVLGNGHAMAQNIFATGVPLAMVLCLALAKPLATLLTVLAGASGGRLTPSLATGAAVGYALALAVGNDAAVPAVAAATIGAAAFLGGAMRAPLAAGVLALEFTGATSLWIPVAIAAVAVWGVGAFLRRGDRGSAGEAVVPLQVSSSEPSSTRHPPT